VKLSDLRTPALLVRLDRVRTNLDRMAELLAPHGGLARWRPHVKTAKVPEVQRMLLERGLRRFKCATTLEVSVLLALADEAGVEIDLLVAMAHRGANLRRVAELARAHSRHRTSVLTEDPAHAREVRSLDARLGLYVDLDPDFGRSGIPQSDRERVAATVDACGDALRGLHSYEGHVRAPTAAERTGVCAPLFDQLCELARSLRLEERETITSGTPTFVEALEHAGLRTLNHSVSPGIVVYWDLNSAALGLAGFRCAASVLARVISSPRPLRVTLDAGSKSLDAAAGDPCAELAGYSARVARPSEEHAPVDFDRGPVPALGDVVELLPRHVCPMINLASHAVLLDGERVLSVVPVAARGHESPPA
jgi:D-serine deaminase-like pyridoxal phosphate-dependent protein